MASLIYQPPTDVGASAIEVRVGGIIYTLSSGVPTYIPEEHFAAVRTAVGAALGTLPGAAAPTVVATSALTAPVAPVIATTGTPGSTSYTYYVVAVDANGDSFPGVAATITTGNATLDGTNFNHLTWTAVTGATSYKVVRSRGGATQGVVGTPASAVFDDQGSSASAYTANNVTTYSYEIVAVDANGDGIPTSAATITNGPATLNVGRYNALSWAAVTEATGYKVIRTAGGGTQGSVTTVTTTSYHDSGGAATTYTPSGANPTIATCALGVAEI